MVNCAIVTCRSRSNHIGPNQVQGVRFFSIPKVIRHQCDLVRTRTERRRAAWIARINRKDLQDADIHTHTKVCSLHFISGQPSALHDEANPDWTPSQSLGYVSSNLPDSSRYDRSKKRFQKKTTSLKSDLSNDVRMEYQEEPIAVNRDITQSTTDMEGFNGQSSPDDDLQPQSQEVLEDPVPAPDSAATASNPTRVPETMNKEEYDSLLKQYREVCDRAKKLRDHVTNLEVDKLELEEQLRSSNGATDTLSKKIIDLEKVNMSLQKTPAILDQVRRDHKEELERLKAEIDGLRDQVLTADNLTFQNLETFASNEEKVKFYTGLPSYSMFTVVLNRVSAHFKESGRCALKPWQNLLLTLMRLRLALSLQDLAYRFGVSVPTASRVFEKWIHAMYVCLYDVLVRWPERETLWKTMPRDFKQAFGRSVAVIVDCFEIFTEKPSSLETRAIMWSNYKHHHTLKVLLGITPTGSISFVSLCWGGRASDKHLTSHSGLYDHLLPNDVVMADRGFDISEDVGFYCAKLLIPAFTRGQDQLSSHDVSLTRKIAHLRIHVERVIGLVRRKYRILQSILPVEMLTKKADNDKAPIDEIVRVCCALTNLCNSVVVNVDTVDPV